MLQQASQALLGWRIATGLLAATLFGFTPGLHAQQTQISGRVTDPSNGAISGAKVELTNSDTQSRWAVQSSSDGLYLAPALPPGEYSITGRAPGFEARTVQKVNLEVGARIAVDLPLELGSEEETVTVDATAAQLNTIDAAVSTVIDQQFVRRMPLNGRSFQSLLTLIPGITAVPSSSGSDGGFSVNGMRSESNYFMVDGVSGNTGVNSSSPGRGAGYSGSVPNATALGTTHTLISVDALQEFRGNTSTYSAEYGRVPGGQFSFTSRSGTNELHGSLFHYFRNDALDANSFFNNRANLQRTKMRQNDFGGTLGGPVYLPGYDGRNKTFFFVSYEGLRLRTPQEARTTGVPSLEMRQIAPDALQPLINSFPLPSAGYPEEEGRTAPFVAAYSQPSSIDSTSVRADHMFTDSFRVFGRAAFTPSNTDSRYSSNLAQITNAQVNSKAITLGGTNTLSPRATNDIRFNATWSDQITDVYIDDFGGATPLRISDLPGQTGADWALLSYRVGARFGFWLNPQNNRQRQFNVVDNFAYVQGRHTLKMGFDFRQLRTDTTLPRFYQTPFYYTEAEFLNNEPRLYTGYRSAGDMAPVYKNLSLYVQDEWAVTNRLRLSLGLRWEWTPAPRDANGNQPVTIDQLDNLATTNIAPQGADLWNTRYKNFGPRIGLAYQVNSSPRFMTVLRLGGGLFHDTSTVQASEGYWYGLGVTGTVNLNGQPFPLSEAELNSIPAPVAKLDPSSYNNIFAFDPNLKTPYSLQWNGTIEQQLGQHNTLSVGYVGSGGRRLLTAREIYPENFENPNFPANTSFLYATVNGATSSYHSLQTQFRRHFSKGLQALSSYTWAHAIDNSSTNFTTSTLLRGSSNYDVRHNFQTAISYDLPSSYDNRAVRALLGGWGVDARIMARSALPIDVTAGTVISPAGIEYTTRPNLVSGQPLYVDVAGAPGGRAINVDAFSLPAAGENGTAGRNIVRGFAAFQTNLAVRREFGLTEQTRLTFRVEAFNVFNQSNFGSINTNISRSTASNPFGWATGTLSSQLGGVNALYQVGGPRSLQLALRLEF